MASKKKKSVKASKRKTSKTKKSRKPSSASIRKRIISALLDQTASESWQAVTLKTISAKTKLSLSEICSVFPTKQAVLNGFLDDIDQKVRTEINIDDLDESPRDRLFDILMRRFDALEPHKKAIANILRDMPGDPVSCLCSASRFGKSMAAMLDAANLSSSGLAGLLKIKGLSLVYLNTARVWLKDETDDLNKTMAALDKNLKRADQAASVFFKN